MPVAFAVKRRGRTGRAVETLDGAALVVGMRPLPHRHALDVAAAAVVAEIERAVGPDRETVRPAAGRREQRDLAVGRHARASIVADLGQDHRSVGHGHRTFRKAEAGRQDTHLAHCIPPLSLFGANSTPTSVWPTSAFRARVACRARATPAHRPRRSPKSSSRSAGADQEKLCAHPRARRATLRELCR